MTNAAHLRRAVSNIGDQHLISDHVTDNHVHLEPRAFNAVTGRRAAGRR